MEFLVVDDDPTSLQIACGMLAALGYALRTAHDGLEALSECRRQAPQAVLMDVQMPRMDGCEATRELRRLQALRELPAFPIIVASAHYSPADRATCFASGADGFVTKPLMLAKLGAEIYRVCRGER